jgi:hypothetical protein
MRDNLINKLKGVVAGAVIGLTSLFSNLGSTDASMMKMESRPTILSKNSDGSSNLRVDVYLTRDVDGDNVADAPEIRGISKWRLTMPSELQPYLTSVSASLPDMTNQKSTNPDDVLYDLKMKTIGSMYNIVNNFIGGVSYWDSTGTKINCRDPPYTSNTFSTKIDGIVASYDLLLSKDAPKGNYSFFLDNTKVYDRNSLAYGSVDGSNTPSMIISNQSFQVVPEPTAIALLGLGGLGLLVRRMRQGKGKWVDSKTLEGKTSK